MSAPVPMIIPHDRPVRWLEYADGLRPGLDNPDTADALLEGCDRILLTAAGTLGVHPADIYRAAWTGRVEWLSPLTPGRTDPVHARLDGGPWAPQPGIRNGVPASGAAPRSGP